MKQTILIIEDEENLVELLKFRLEANGYLVETAFNGVEGLDKVERLKPNLVVLDLMMPKMNGFEVCRLSKANPATKDIPMIMLTAHAQQEDLQKAADAGADEYVTKPFEPKDLLVKIETLIHERN